MIFIIGCILTIEYYHSSDYCLDRPKTCFVMSKSFPSFSPIDQFVCNAGEIVKTPNSASILTIFFTLLYRLFHFIYGRIIVSILLLVHSMAMFLFAASKIRLDFLQYYLTYIILMICFITVWSRPIIKYLRWPTNLSTIK